MQRQTEEEIEKLNASLNDYYQNQSALAVNRLAVSSIFLGAGAVITGYFGMNFAREFGGTIFEGGFLPVHYALIVFATVFSAAALLFSFWLIGVNWRDYRQILRRNRGYMVADQQSLRRVAVRSR